MIAIYKKEISLFFGSLIGQLIIGVFLVINNLILWSDFSEFNILNNSYANMDVFFNIAPIIFLFLIPAISMKTFSEEYNVGTIENIITKPIPIYNIILGKYFSVLTIVFLAIIPTFISVISLYFLGEELGNLDLPAIFGSYLCLFLLSTVLVLHGTNDNVINYNGGNFPNYGPYMSAPNIVNEWVSHNLCSLDTSYSLLDVNNDNNITDVTKYQNNNTGDKVWFYKINNGLHAWFDVAPWGNDDFWASEEIWNFFNQVGVNTTSLNEQEDLSEKNISRIINTIGKNVQFPSNNLLFHIYDDGSVEKRISIE